MTSLHIHNKLERQKVTSQNKKSHFFINPPILNELVIRLNEGNCMLTVGQEVKGRAWD